jgi:hypothetical protein
MELSARATRATDVRLRPGAYVSAESWARASEREQHLARVRAAARSLTDRAVFSHESAAAVHGIPIAGGWPRVVHASYDGDGGMAARAGLRFSRARWSPGDVLDFGTMRVTSPRRTAADLARTAPFTQGVIALEHVLAAGIDRREFVAWVGAQRGVHGLRRAVRALDLCHGLSESPLESLSLARFAELGIPSPVQQQEFVVGGERFRVDFFWPQWGVVGEADGRLKYRDPQDLWREKRREDALRRVVGTVVRWTWQEAWRASPLAALLSAAGIPRV